MKVRAGLLILVLGIAAAAAACLWDNDTVAMEGEGLPSVMDAIAGRFDRNPDLYYEMRLERSLAEIEADPESLMAYGNVAVALDKLGRSAEAIPMLEDRIAAVDANDPDLQDHLYKLYANLGTVRVHDWLQRGASTTEFGDLEQAITEIDPALEINPEAHFGREFVQLFLMEMLLNERLDPEPRQRTSHFYETFVNPEGVDQAEHWDKIIEGVTGMVVMGGGWKSPDMYSFLGGVLTSKERAVIGSLAEMRAAELKDAGAPSLFSKETIWTFYAGHGSSALSKEEREDIYSKLRANGDAYTQNRLEFMMPKLEQGEHPDTHADFWAGYTEVPALDLETLGPQAGTLWFRDIRNLIKLGLWIAATVFFGGIAAFIYVRKRNERKANQIPSM
jgi:tetratricopeptide (TPR) repeat protein